eukprot:evm.model.NODE_14001_length_5083_cov_41.411568.2
MLPPSCTAAAGFHPVGRLRKDEEEEVKEGGREGKLLGRASSFPAALHAMDSAVTHVANEDEEHYQARVARLEEEERERRRRERERKREGLLSFGGMVQRLGSSLRRERSEVEREGEEEEVKEELSSIALVPRVLEGGEVEEEGSDSDSEMDYREAEESADFDYYSDSDVAADVQEEGEKGEGEEGEEEEGEEEGGRDAREGEEEKDVDGLRK